MKKVLSILMIICVMISVLSVPTFAGTLDHTKTYIKEFESYLGDIGYGPSYEGEYWYAYGERYEYYSEDNNTDTPDWLLVGGGVLQVGPMNCYGVFGDYYILKGECSVPYELGYFVYVPAENKFYRLETAWNEGFEGIESAFTECLLVKGWAGYIGDADGDNRITILDAAYIQRCLAGLSKFSVDDEIVGLKATATKDLEYISDFNMDGKRSVSDATAIQKKLAHIVE